MGSVLFSHSSKLEDGQILGVYNPQQLGYDHSVQRKVGRMVSVQEKAGHVTTVLRGGGEILRWQGCLGSSRRGISPPYSLTWGPVGEGFSFPEALARAVEAILLSPRLLALTSLQGNLLTAARSKSHSILRRPLWLDSPLNSWELPTLAKLLTSFCCGDFESQPATPFPTRPHTLVLRNATQNTAGFSCISPQLLFLDHTYSVHPNPLRGSLPGPHRGLHKCANPHVEEAAPGSDSYQLAPYSLPGI